MPKPQVYVVKSCCPTISWRSGNWKDINKIAKVYKSVSGRVTVGCKDVTNMNHMFCNCSYITTIDLSNFDTSNVVDMSSMFYDCDSLTTLDLSNFDTSKVKDMMRMFYGCSKLTTLDLSSFDTSKVKDMCAMFINCSNLTTIKGVIDMKSCKYFYEDMFYNCPKLAGVKIKNPPADFESKTGLSSSQYTVVNE
nr:MAG TPA: protein of unknown function DUF285 [Caudoviricetes sp.]